MGREFGSPRCRSGSNRGSVSIRTGPKHWPWLARCAERARHSVIPSHIPINTTAQYRTQGRALPGREGEGISTQGQSPSSSSLMPKGMFPLCPAGTRSTPRWIGSHCPSGRRKSLTSKRWNSWQTNSDGPLALWAGSRSSGQKGSARMREGCRTCWSQTSSACIPSTGTNRQHRWLSKNTGWGAKQPQPQCLYPCSYHRALETKINRPAATQAGMENRWQLLLQSGLLTLPPLFLDYTGVLRMSFCICGSMHHSFASVMQKVTGSRKEMTWIWYFDLFPCVIPASVGWGKFKFAAINQFWKSCAVPLYRVVPSLKSNHVTFEQHWTKGSA